MLTDKQIRVDKWLWAVRIFKTRNQATEACKKGRIFIQDQPVKPSRILKVNDIVRVKKPPVVFSYRVTGLLAKRLSARLIRDYMEDVTPEEEREKRRVILEGDVPSPANPPVGCNFCTRCPAKERVRKEKGIDCDTVEPEFLEVEPGHWVACHLY